ncbi:MAG: substrate-binding domain-containing protein [Planctomycetes bacterium]|nr:substrate-binding domain-containing protein [Planctomycetota bacterium]
MSNRTSNKHKTILLAAVILGLLAGIIYSMNYRKATPRESRSLRIFHAAGLTPLLEAIREDCQRDLGITIETESAGSQTVARMLTELGRQCDLIMLADASLITKMLQSYCSWRIDFATDEVVLGVGVRAPYIDEAESDWLKVLLNQDVRLGRVDENQGPIGFRTLLVWKLLEQKQGGVYDTLFKKAGLVIDHVSHLTPLLKIGEIDYAFIYRSICIASDIRFIELDKAINLGAAEMDYSSATVTFKSLKANHDENITVTGSPILWTMSIPDRNADQATAQVFVEYLLSKKSGLITETGFRLLAPSHFHGQQGTATSFKGGFIKYMGPLQ